MMCPAECRRARVALGISVKDLAAATAVPPFWIRTFEAGRAGCPDGDIRKMQRALEAAGHGFRTGGGRQCSRHGAGGMEIAIRRADVGRKMVAIAWLEPEDWIEWRQIAPELVPYSVWLAKIKNAMVQAEALGAVPVKVTVRPAEYLEWCKANDKDVGRVSRAQFAAEQLVRRMRR